MEIVEKILLIVLLVYIIRRIMNALENGIRYPFW